MIAFETVVDGMLYCGNHADCEVMRMGYIQVIRRADLFGYASRVEWRDPVGDFRFLLSGYRSAWIPVEDYIKHRKTYAEVPDALKEWDKQGDKHE